MTLLDDYIQLCRLHRPIGIWLLLFPGFIGLSAAQKQVPFSYWIVFAIGAVAMRSAGCIYNDIIDRPFDRDVTRTKNRPMVRPKKPVSLKQALVFLILNLIIGFICLMQFNLATILIGLVAAILIVGYPWMKRITYWPQLFLGFTMNMGFLIGWAAMDETINSGALLLYLGMVSWTLGYDTIYGFQDMSDDALIGVKSASIKMQGAPKIFVGIVYAITALSWIISGVLMSFSLVYYLGLGSVALLFFWQVITLNSKDPVNCLHRFQSNQWVGILLWLSLIMNN